MNPTKLITTINDVFNNPHINLETFPYDYITGITEGKPWEKDFVESLKKSDLNEPLKTKILQKYETIDLR